MSNNRKIDLEARLASRRFGKETHLTALIGKQLIDFIQRNSLFPPGFFITDPNYGYSSIRNRVVAIPSYNTRDLIEELNNIGLVTPFNPVVHSNGSPAGVNRIIDQLASSEALYQFLKQTMVIVCLTNFNLHHPISLLGLMDISIDTIDVAGTINGTLVPRTKTDPNEVKSAYGK